MSTIINSYPVFEDNQVLTSTQLNNLVNYLDQQNMLTRVKLIGMGIVCGLDISFDDTVTPNQITISKGTGITSEGFLVNMGECVNTQYRAYDLPEGVIYQPFMDDNLVQDVTLYELLTASAVPDPGETFFELDNTDTAEFLSDKVVLVFLECFDKDLKSCLGKSCDEIGIDRIVTTRKVLISESDLETVLARTNNLNGVSFSGKFDLPSVTMRRTLFDPETEPSTDYISFSKNYSDSFTDTYQDLLTALNDTYSVFQPVLSSTYGGVNPFSTIPDQLAWQSFLNGNSSGPSYLGMQYFYDFLKDLILAYNEFRKASFELVSECCPDMSRFPKHLMLGEAIPLGTCTPSRYRQQFISSTLFNSKNLLERVITLHKRIVLMLRKFNLDRVNDPVGTETVRATPSCEKKSMLTERAIPYYYDIDSADVDLGTLEENWDFDLFQTCPQDDVEIPILSYSKQNIDDSDDFGPIESPLRYDLDPFNFLRIEGHIGRNYQDVVDRLEALKTDFDLPIDIIAVRLEGDDPFDDVTVRCDFTDLSSQYQVCREAMICELQNLFDQFAVKDESSDVVSSKEFPEELDAALRDRNLLGNVFTTGTGLAEQAPVFAKLAKFSLVNQLQNDAVQLGIRLLRLRDELMPFTFSEFDFGLREENEEPIPIAESFYETYSEAIQLAIDLKIDFNNLLDKIIRNTGTKNTDDFYATLTQYFAEVFSCLNGFIKSCKHEQLKALYYIGQYRITYLKENDLTKFTNFIKKHPGVDHKAGVQMGGTFVVVYLGDETNIDVDVVETVRRDKKLLAQKEREISILNAKPKKSKAEAIKLVRLEEQAISLIDLEKTIIGGGIPAQNLGITEDQVIADFALPYLCCSDILCEDIPSPVEGDVNMPVLALPQFVSYDLGAYSFAPDVNFAATGDPDATGSITINVINSIQFDRQQFADSSVRLRLIENGAIRVYEEPVSESSRTSQQQSFPVFEKEFQVDSITTFNKPNDPDNNVAYGTVTLILSSTGTPPMRFLYKPNPGFIGVDSFSYVFEILDATGAIQQSACGTVTVDVHNASPAALTDILIDIQQIQEELVQVKGDTATSKANSEAALEFSKGQAT
jgi:hypothetical protein